MISLICCDETFNQIDEPKRKQFHDMILMEYNIQSPQTYDWGTVTSCYDPRGNISSINIMYF